MLTRRVSSRNLIALTLAVSALIASSCQSVIAEPVCADPPKYEGPALRVAPSMQDFPRIFQASKSVSTTQTTDLERVLGAAQAAFDLPALTAAVIQESGEAWAATRTTSGTSPTLFYWASVGKAWVAIAVLQLVEEGRLDLADHLEKWAPDFPNAKLITVGQLLQHTSGAFSFQEDPSLRATPGFKPREQLLAIARSYTPSFCPGQTWGYSNTGYVLLGLIVEQVDGRRLDQALHACIVDRLQLKETRILAPGDALEAIAPPQSAGLPNNGTGDDIRTPGAAGPVVASANDMALFWAAALRGDLTSTQSAHDQYASLYPMFGQPETSYGRGVMRFDLPATSNTPADIWLGHSGGLPGAKAVVAWSVRKRTVVAVALTGDGSAEAIANRLIAALN